MNYNFDFRFRRALNPQGLRIIETANHAILEAIQDCRNSGLDPECQHRDKNGPGTGLKRGQLG